MSDLRRTFLNTLLKLDPTFSTIWMITLWMEHCYKLNYHLTTLFISNTIIIIVTMLPDWNVTGTNLQFMLILGKYSYLLFDITCKELRICFCFKLICWLFVYSFIIFLCHQVRDPFHVRGHTVGNDLLDQMNSHVIFAPTQVSSVNLN